MHDLRLLVIQWIIGGVVLMDLGSCGVDPTDGWNAINRREIPLIQDDPMDASGGF